ncbi:MAG: response regulator transcription factor [Actinomycetota bacterium]
MSATEPLEHGRESFRRQAWGDAYSQLSAADKESPLEADDTYLLAAAAHLTGRDDERSALWARAHQQFLDLGDVPRAVRSAFNLIMGLADQGDFAQMGGWVGRARRILEESGQDCAEQGYLLIPIALQSLGAGDAAGGLATFAQVAKVADRFDDLDLKALGRLGRGRALVNFGEVAEGVAMMDEAMVAVTTGEVSPIVSGVVYCAMIEICQDIFDLRRAQEWTTALSHWCSSQPDLVPFRGQCLVHRVEIMRLHGAWPDATEEVQRACELYGRFPRQPAAPAAYYEQAELYRLRGELSRAEEGYRQVARFGRTPQPGLARLRLAQGQVKAAEASIRLAMDEAKERSARAKLLPAFVEIMLAADDAGAAHEAAVELAEFAADMNATWLEAMATYANGSVQLAKGDAKAALSMLREAWLLWKELDAPYEGAQARTLIGLACRQLGDEDTAQMELDAARWVFRQLGAVFDVSNVDALLRKDHSKAAGGLTAREVEVLRLVAAGRTNKAIASDLFLSEKTVARHVSNIFTKLGVASRSAATAFAFQNELIRT